MDKKAVSGIMLTLLLVGMLTLAYNIQQVKADGTSHDLQAVTCTDKNRAWAVGIMGTILHTANGGETWELQSSGTDWHLYDVTFINTNEGWTVGEHGTILHTEDGGASWYPQISGTTQMLRSVCFLDDTTGWVVGDAAILCTTNGGDSWEDQMSGVPEKYRDEYLNTVFFKNASVGWAGGNIWDEIVLCTNDGGMSWSAEDLWAPHRSGYVRDIYFTDSDHGWMLGWGALHTIDGGATWELLGCMEGNSLVFPERNTGWVAGTYGVIMHTIDCAHSWIEQSTGTTVTLHDLCFADVNTGWAVGDQGTILSYTEEIMYAPVASFTYQPPAPYVGDAVIFNASTSYDSDGTVVSYFWDFGDGYNDTGMIVNHAYSVEGTFTITLTVTDNDGLTNATTADITVTYRVLSIKLSGEHDYLFMEKVKIRVAALVTDAETMEPVSNADVVIEIYDPDGELWVSANMVEKLPATGIYEWETTETIRQLMSHRRLSKGVYLAHVQASYGGGPTATDILEFHIDPPQEQPIELKTMLLVTMIGIIGIIASGWFIDHRRLSRKTV